MNLVEYKSKEVFADFNIPVPKGRTATSPSQVADIAAEMGEVVIKAQVEAGGRGKAGGIRFASSPEEARDEAEEILRMEIQGQVVKEVLVEEKLGIEKELYAGITIDRAEGKPVFMVSSEGGVEIEVIAEECPEKIFPRHIDPFVGLYPYATRELASKLNLEPQSFKEVGSMLMSLYRVFLTRDAQLAEINPLVVAREGVYAADAKLVLDEDAHFRQDFGVEKSLPYVELQGDIGCIVNGAGLAMATMDTIKNLGGEPANFLDIGGGASSGVMNKALEKVSSHPGVRVILVNILGGITRCDEIARGIVEASRETGKPLVVRLRGTREKEGVRILQGEGYEVERDMIRAVKKAIKAAGGKK